MPVGANTTNVFLVCSLKYDNNLDSSPNPTSNKNMIISILHLFESNQKYRI